MDHLSDIELYALLDGESLAPARAAIGHEVASCSVCSRRLAQLRGAEAAAQLALNASDHTVPAVDVDAVIERARQSSRRRWVPLAAAAALLLAVGAAGATGAGSALPALVRRLVHGADRTPVVKLPASPIEGAPPSVVQGPSGVAVVPTARVRISLRDPQQQGSLRVRFADDSALHVTDIGGGVTYTLTSDGVAIDNRGSSASYDVVVPRAVLELRITVGGRVVLAITGGVPQQPMPRDSAGSMLIPLAR